MSIYRLANELDEKESIKSMDKSFLDTKAWSMFKDLVDNFHQAVEDLEYELNELSPEMTAGFDHMAGEKLPKAARDLVHLYKNIKDIYAGPLVPSGVFVLPAKSPRK